jgi:hypothetical protein
MKKLVPLKIPQSVKRLSKEHNCLNIEEIWLRDLKKGT